MQTPEPATRPYRSALREEQAQRTRVRIAQSARSRFVDTGWSGTSMRAVAAAAGVSEATVYAVYGSKAGLATALVDVADAAADVTRVLRALERATGNPTAQLAALVGFDRRLFEHGGDLLRVIVEGRRQSSDLAAAYTDGRTRGEQARRRVFATWPAAAWQSGVGVRRALDVYAVLCTIDAYDIATVERGWSPSRVERWWHQTLVEQLLA